MKHSLLPAFAALAVLCLAPLTAHAQTVIVTGHHDDNQGTSADPYQDGYDTTDDNTLYIVPVDKASGFSATFNNNSGSGFGAYVGDVSIYGGQFAGNNAGISVSSSGHASVYGGIFSNTTYQGFLLANVDFNTDGPIDVYGQFDGLSLGETKTLGAFEDGQGQFHGTLQYAKAAQTFSYNAFAGGTVILHDVAPAPEPSSVAALAVGVLGLGVLALRARKRSLVRPV